VLVGLHAIFPIVSQVPHVGMMAKPSQVIVRSEPGGQLLRVVERVAGGVGTAVLEE